METETIKVHQLKTRETYSNHSRSVETNEDQYRRISANIIYIALLDNDCPSESLYHCHGMRTILNRQELLTSCSHNNVSIPFVREGIPCQSMDSPSFGMIRES